MTEQTNITNTEDDADIRRWRSVWRRLFRTFAWAIGLLYFPVLMSFVGAERNELVCEKVVPFVHKSESDVLITEKGLRNIIADEFPELLGSKVSTIDFDKIEKVLVASPVVRRAEAYPAADGSVHIHVYQRRPIARVFTSDGSSYYMDAEGYKISARAGMLCHTLVINGHVNSLADRLDGLLSLCKHISEDGFFRSMVEQVTVTAEGEYILVPRVGDHVVYFGNADNVEQKFADLLTLYKKGWAKDEWNAYKSVSLKYKGQIICTKR